MTETSPGTPEERGVGEAVDPAAGMALQAGLARTPTGVLSLDGEGRIRFAVGGVLERFDLPDGDLAGLPAARAFRSHPALVEAVERALAGETVRTLVAVGGSHVEVHLAREGGGNGSGTPAGVAGVLVVAEDLVAAEAARQETEARYQRLVENVPVGLYRTTPDGRILDVNAAVLETFGYPSVDALKEAGMEALYLDLEDRERLNAELLEADVVEGHEMRYRRRDGTAIWVRENIRVVRDEAGEVRWFEGSLEDTTAEREAQEALRARERRFREMAETIEDVFWVIDTASQDIVYVSPAVEAVTGYPPAAIEGAFDTWANLTVEEDRAALQAALERAIREGEVELRYRIRDAHDRERWVRSRGYRVDDASGSRIIGITTDVTDQVRREEVRRRLEERIEAYFEATTDLAFRVEPDSLEFLEVSPAVTGLLGLVPEDVVGRPFPEFLHPDDRGETLEAHRAIVAGGAGRPMEVRVRNARGGYVPLSLVGRPIRRDGEVVEVFGIARDLTHQKTVQEELEQQARDLEELAYVTAHDLQEPLRDITRFVQLLERRFGDELGEEGREYVDFAVRGTKRMSKLLEGLLTYHRMGERLDDVGQVDLDAVLDEVLLDLGEAVERTGARVDRTDPLPTVDGDAVGLGIVFRNLVANALKFHRPGVPPVVHVGCEATVDGWRITVADEGIGIPPEHRERIFGMFRRLHSRSEFEGTGIGLAVTKRVVERHGGRIGVEGNPRGGATFVVELPHEGRLS